MIRVLQMMVWLSFALNTNAQLSITANVYNEQNQALQGASITLLNEKKWILLYGVTNAEGKFTFKIQDSLSKYKWIEVSMIGYETQILNITPQQTIYNFTIKNKAFVLDEVVVEPPIQWKGDTIIYKVKSFATEEDRSIADVLKKMPGIRVDEKGKIFFNDREIANLYFEGDELMDGRYGAATQVLKKEMIKDVQILQNHQPIKVLRNKKSSDAISMNFILEDADSWKLSGNGELSIGTPYLYALQISAIILNKKLKTINLIQTNNIGQDYKQGFSRLANQTGSNINQSNPMLSSGTVSEPNIPKKYYYDNRSSLGSLNISYKNKNENSSKTNFVAWNDRQQFDYQNITTYQTATDTITFQEVQNALIKPWSVEFSQTYEANKDNFFFFNRTSVDLKSNQGSNQLWTQNNPLEQSLQDKPISFTNAMNYHPQTKWRGIFGMEWLSSYRKRNESLWVNQGLHPQIIHGNIPFDETNQSLSLKQIYNQVQINYLLNQKNFRHRYNILLKNENKQLESVLMMKEMLDWKKWDQSVNDLNWVQQSTIIQAEYSWHKPQKLDASIILPLQHQWIQYRQTNIHLNEQKNKVWFTPGINFKWIINSYQEVAIQAGRNQTVSDIHSIYRGAILTNYRNIQSNQAGLIETKTQQISLKYQFRNPIKMFFLHAGLDLNNSLQNAIHSLEMDNDIQKTVIIPLSNKQKSQQIQLSINKYSFLLKSNLSYQIQYSKSSVQQWINQAINPIQLYSTSHTVGIDTRIIQKIQLNYQTRLNYSNMVGWNKNQQSKIYQLQQNIKMSWHVSSQLDLSTDWKYAYNKNHLAQSNQYLFADASLRYRIKKWNTDIECTLTNLANVKTFEIWNLLEGYRSQNIYMLRGRMILFKMNYIF